MPGLVGPDVHDRIRPRGHHPGLDVVDVIRPEEQQLTAPVLVPVVVEVDRLCNDLGQVVGVGRKPLLASVPVDRNLETMVTEIVADQITDRISIGVAEKLERQL